MHVWWYSYTPSIASAARALFWVVVFGMVGVANRSSAKPQPVCGVWLLRPVARFGN